MNFKRENTEGGVKLSFTVDAKEWDAFLDRAFRKNQEKINIPGFRKGKAPRHLVEKMYGRGMFIDDAFNYCFRDSYSKALDQNPDIYPVDEPKVEIEKVDDKGVEFYATVTVKPTVVLSQYKGIEVPKAEYNVTDKDIDAELNKAKERLSRKVEVEREIKDGDEINLDYSGSIDGVKFEGGTAKAQTLIIGSNSFIPGFESQLIGKKKGETCDIEVTFPAEYHAEELKGKKSVFNITINNIYVKEYPEINDEMAKEASRFETLAEYKEDIKKTLTESFEARAKAENEEALIKAIVENTEVKIPDCMADTELDYMLHDFANQLKYMYGGMKLEDYFKYTNTSIDDYRKERHDDAIRNVKTRLIMEKIIEEEKIEVSDEDVEKEIENRAEKAKKTKDEYKKSISGEQMMYLRNAVLSNKLMDFLTSNNNFVAGKKENSANENAEKPAKKAAAAKSTAKEPKEKPASKESKASNSDKGLEAKKDAKSTKVKSEDNAKGSDEEAAKKPATKRAPCNRKPKA